MNLGAAVHYNLDLAGSVKQVYSFGLLNLSVHGVAAHFTGLIPPFGSSP